MNHKNQLLLTLLFLLCIAGATASPIVRVDPTVMICEKACSNSTTVQQGPEHIQSAFTASL